MSSTDNRVIRPLASKDVLLNSGMGYLHIQRGHNKVKFDELSPDCWFLRDRYSNKITFDIAWSVIEPREGEFDWENKDWEGCFNSWIKAGYKIAIQVRGMGAQGTLYNDGVPQWVFDAGAKFIDEYKKDSSLPPNRYPVYWDPVYFEKVANLVEKMGQRYNCNPDIEFIMPGFIGHFGEMHISEHTPIRPWVEAGFCIENYFKAIRQQTEIFKKAFPNKPLYQELGNPCYNDPDPSLAQGPVLITQAREIVPYLVEQGINLKYNGLGANWDCWGNNSNMEGWFIDYANAYYTKVKMIVENIAAFHAPDELATLFECHASYTNRGGERQGVPEIKINTIEDDCFPKMLSFDPLSKLYYLKHSKSCPQLREETQRESARIVGYKLTLKELNFPSVFQRGESILLLSYWQNSGAALPHENFKIVYALKDENGNMVWSVAMNPVIPTSTIAWDSHKTVGERSFITVPETVKQGNYELAIGMIDNNNTTIQLPLFDRDQQGFYPLASIVLK